MEFKTERIKDQFYNNIHIFLVMIVCDANEFCMANFNKTFTITRCTDPVPGESGVHLIGRGVDARNEYADTFAFSKEESEILVEYINEKYKRYDGKLTVKLHSFNGGPEHFHFQLAPKIDAYEAPKKLRG